MTLDDLERRIQGLPKVLKYPLLSHERVKLQLQILYAYSLARSEQKSIKNVEKISCGRSQGLPKIFRAPIYWAHRAVIFAIAQFSC